MVIVTGAVSLLTLATVGFSVAAVVVIAGTALLVIGGQAPRVDPWQRRGLGAGGAALGVVAWYRGFEPTILVVAAVTLLAVSALLAAAQRKPGSLLHSP